MIIMGKVYLVFLRLYLEDITLKLPKSNITTKLTNTIRIHLLPNDN